MSKDYYSDIMKYVDKRKKEDERDYIGLINAGVTAQIEKLRENEHKQAIETHTFIDLKLLVDEEYNELMMEFFQMSFHDATNYSEMRHEAADLANICHAIIRKCDQEMMK